jgi:hypothetical protein
MQFGAAFTPAAAARPWSEAANSAADAGLTHKRVLRLCPPAGNLLDRMLRVAIGARQCPLRSVHHAMNALSEFFCLLVAMAGEALHGMDLLRVGKLSGAETEVACDAGNFAVGRLLEGEGINMQGNRFSPAHHGGSLLPMACKTFVVPLRPDAARQRHHEHGRTSKHQPDSLSL